jgi:hypothetical protein
MRRKSRPNHLKVLPKNWKVCNKNIFYQLNDKLINFGISDKMIVSKAEPPRIIDVHREIPGTPMTTSTDTDIGSVRDTLIALIC